jgi:hypothetical protein
MLATKPEPTGSTTPTNTIGTLRLACCKAVTAGVVVRTMTSGSSATNSRTYLRKSSRPPAAQRVSNRTLRPVAQPNL